MKLRKDLFNPASLSSEESNRHSNWLELLYDLIFVAAISLLALNLSSNYSFAGFLESIPLFFVIWWGWVGHTFYLSRFGTDDLLHRFFTMAQMLAVASLAVNVKGALGQNGEEFALSYAVLRLMLVVEYYRVGRYIKEARPLTNHYCIGFGFAALLWAISAFVPSPWRFILWGIALVIDILTPVSAREKHIKLPPHSTHLPERFGLFTIILIGEAIVSIVFKMADLGFTFTTEITSIMGLIIAFSIWWGYFEESKGAEARVQEEQEHVNKYQLWLYSHFPLLLGIVSVAAGIKHVISLDLYNFLPLNEVWMLCFSLALAFISLNLIFLSSFDLEQCKKRKVHLLRLPYYIIVILVLCTGFLGSILPGSAILFILTILCIFKVFLSLRESSLENQCKI